MLKITMELWPYGDESLAKEIGKVFLANTGLGTPRLGDYVAVLDDQAGDPQEIMLHTHDRTKGAWYLLYQLLHEHFHGEPQIIPAGTRREVLDVLVKMISK